MLAAALCGCGRIRSKHKGTKDTKVTKEICDGDEELVSSCVFVSFVPLWLKSFLRHPPP